MGQLQSFGKSKIIHKLESQELNIINRNGKQVCKFRYVYVSYKDQFKSPNIKLKMKVAQQQPTIKQFRTVITGYRYHGQLLTYEEQSSQFFILKIQSSLDKQQKYLIKFDSQSLDQYGLNEVFSQPVELYQYVSKMTKKKIKFDNQLKTFSVLCEKQKKLQKYIINLSGSHQQPFKSDEKKSQEQKIQQKIVQNQTQAKDIQRISQLIQIQSQPLTNWQRVQTCNTQQTTEAATKTQQITQQMKVNAQDDNPKTLQQMIKTIKNQHQPQQPRQQVQTSVLQKKQINYDFLDITQQSQNLYEYALRCRIDVLVGSIQNQQLDQIQQLGLKRLSLGEVPPFNQIKKYNIRLLNLLENKISKIANLQTMTTLQKIYLDGNQISCIDNLSHLVNLKVLKLGDNQIQQINGLQNLANLTTLWLDFNNIHKIQGLQELNKLQSLNLSFNKIQRIQNLQNLHSLKELLLNENQITKIQNLETLTNLARLSINMNSVYRIRGLRKLLLLQIVYLSQNEIQQFNKYAFEQINWLRMLKQLKLGGNNIKWTDQQKGFREKLRKYGIKVTV